MSQNIVKQLTHFMEFVVPFFKGDMLKSLFKEDAMRLSFKMDYGTYWGQRLYVIGSINELGSWDTDRAFALECPFPDTWEGDIEINLSRKKLIEYKYFLKNEKTGEIQWEWGENRKLLLEPVRFNQVRCRDFWRTAQNIENSLFSSAFTDVLMKRISKSTTSQPSTKRNNKILRLQIFAPRVGIDYQLCVVGNQATLKNWNTSTPLLMNDSGYPTWSLDIDASKLEFPIQYKYGLYHKKTKKVISLEEGSDRMIRSFVCTDNKSMKAHTDSNYRYPVGMWKGAGISIPLFSLRTQNDCGIGEFSDIIPLADWANMLGMKLIQFLPVNETTVIHTWTDSHPYSSISVFALHPIYLNMEKIGKVKDKSFMNEFKNSKELLNSLDALDYETVINLKTQYLVKIFNQEKDRFLKNEDFKTFLKNNENWLVPYAAFCFLKNKYATIDFNQWEEYSTYDPEKIKKLTNPRKKIFNEIAIHYFAQYHLHKQLLEASEYAKERGVVLKVDIPFCVDPHSVEVWQHPQYFNTNTQVGTPPDEFSAKGQNWGFPSYNWKEISKDNFTWWQKRLTHLSQYFEAYRLDHIQNFFRTWEIPKNSVTPKLGRFKPTYPITRDELQDQEIWFDYERLCNPYIHEYFLWDTFGDLKEQVKQDFLDQVGDKEFKLKEDFNTQRKIDDFFTYGRDESELSSNEIRIRDGLFELCEKVVFIPDSNSHGEGFHPRVNMDETESYVNLDEATRNKLESIYIEYLFHRQNDLWKEEALKILPAIINTTQMLPCGEDLGMAPRVINEVMTELGILSLEVQRIPKDPDIDFLHPADVPYLSVLTTSTSYMPTLREWWEEDEERSQRFFKLVIGRNGEAPKTCDPWLAKEIINQQLSSGAMWVIIPFQDLMALDGELRHENYVSERVNVPSNSNHYWRYRMHLNIEVLLKEDKFNNTLYNMIKNTDRNTDY